MKIQYKMALVVIGGILAVLAIMLVIAFAHGDETNSNNEPGGGVGIGRLGHDQHRLG